MGEDPAMLRQHPRRRSARKWTTEGREFGQAQQLGTVGVRANGGEWLDGSMLPRPDDRLQGVGWLDSDEYDIEIAGRNFLAYIELLRRWKEECE